jgi:hypothetical protein
MYDLDSLVVERTVHVVANRHPVSITLDSQGVAPARFVLARIPGSDPIAWAAAVWTDKRVGDPDPPLLVAERVERVNAFSLEVVDLNLEGDRRLVVRRGRGCSRCGSALTAFTGWPGCVRLVSLPLTAVEVDRAA